MTTSPFENIQHVPPSIICDIFNKSQFPRQIREGVLQQKIIRNDHLDMPEKVGEPYCTYSQFIRYYDSGGTWIVEIHQYYRSATGTIGASGKPEPKRLRAGNIIYVSDKNATITEE